MARNPEIPCKAKIEHIIDTEGGKPSTQTIFDCKTCEVSGYWRAKSSKSALKAIVSLKSNFCKDLKFK